MNSTPVIAIPPFSRWRVARPWLLVAFAAFAADQVTKYLMDRPHDFAFSRDLIPGFARLVHHRNPGVAFGLLADVDSRWVSVLVVVIPIAAAGLFLWLLVASSITTTLSRCAIALLLGGTVGNLTDRILHGGVLDFLLLNIGRYQWPAFNVADSAVTIGGVLFLFDAIRGSRRPAPNSSGQSASTEKPS